MDDVRNAWAALSIFHDIFDVPWAVLASKYPSSAPTWVAMSWMLWCALWTWVASVVFAGLRAQRRWLQSFGKRSAAPMHVRMPDGQYLHPMHDKLGKPVRVPGHYESDPPRLEWIPCPPPDHKPAINKARVKVTPKPVA